ncbi:hypothetical protein [Streptomyces lydicus]|uniref:hypothetical protein n=2 Tax=Streptomyces lydicus TaxID=47763 RepID=UPI001B805C8C|nr:hypothetical protein [Streptomyces lydicus]MDC7341293.1 hypothetical protein [Streptomyces lydicus]
MSATQEQVHEQIRVRLAAAVGADAADIGRIAQEAALCLHEGGQEPDFEVRSADFVTDPFFVCADRYWRRRFAESPSSETALACARWIAVHTTPGCRSAVREQWTLGNGFINRSHLETREQLDEAARSIAGAPEAADLALTVLLYHAGKLRANFSFDDLNSVLTASALATAAGPHRDEPVVLALRSFAAFGSRAVTTEHARDLLDRAWSAPQRSRHVVDVCLNGLAFSVPFNGQGELLRQLAQEAVDTHPDDHMFRFRLATAHHLCADHDAALSHVDAAVAMLARHRTFSNELILEQYLVKRDAIQEARLRAAREAEHEVRWRRQDAANAELERAMHRSSVRAVELVAVFTSAIAFAIGSLQVTLNGNLKLRERLWLLTGLGAGLAVFALIIVGGTWLITRRRSRR